MPTTENLGVRSLQPIGRPVESFADWAWQLQLLSYCGLQVKRKLEWQSLPIQVSSPVIVHGVTLNNHPLYIESALIIMCRIGWQQADGDGWNMLSVIHAYVTGGLTAEYVNTTAHCSPYKEQNSTAIMRICFNIKHCKVISPHIHS